MVISTSKWRDPVVEPFDLNLGPDLFLNEVTGYPHAGNDVFLCRGLYRNEPTEFYLKIARHQDANLSNEAAALERLESASIMAPSVLLHGRHGNPAHEFLAITSMPGQRMSGALAEPDWQAAKSDISPYLVKIAKNLLQVHALALDWPPVRPRTQFSIPLVDHENPSRSWLQEKITWLRKHQPPRTEPCFVHGDHHYANLLWRDGELSAVLDWELCGLGWREFDLAWSVLPRPGQQFLTTLDEQYVFLEAYQQGRTFDFFAVVWCFTLIATHFLSIKSIWDEPEYHARLMSLSQKYSDLAT